MPKRSLALIIAILGLIISVTALSLPAGPSPQAQVLYATPTADADGRIFYTVKDGDTCISVSLLNQISLDDLRLFNNLGVDCILISGTRLLLGTVAPEPTQSGPAATETPLLPSATPFQGNGQVCIVLFDDANGNALAEGTEPAIAGGAISITDRIGRVSLTGDTAASMEEPTCFTDLQEGEYNISVAVPEGYNPTTRLNYALQLKAGDNSQLDFGAQASSAAAATPLAEGGRSPLLGILGAIIIIAGAGLAIYARVVLRK